MFLLSDGALPSVQNEKAFLMGEAASGASIASVLTDAAGSYITGQAKASSYAAQATNFLYEGSAKALNYSMDATTKAANYQYEGLINSANYEYKGAAEQAQYGLQAGQDTAQAERAERAADLGRVQAATTDVALRENMVTTLGGIETRAAAGKTYGSPTDIAFEEHQEQVAERDRGTQMLAIHAQIGEDKSTAAYLRGAASFALTQGNIAKNFADFNADATTKMASYNADTATKMGAINAGIAMTSGQTQAAQAEQQAGYATTAGWVGALAKVFGGLGKAAAT
jgi:hypothetical protein